MKWKIMYFKEALWREYSPLSFWISVVFLLVTYKEQFYRKLEFSSLYCYPNDLNGNSQLPENCSNGSLWYSQSLSRAKASSKGGSRHKNWCMARVLGFLIRYFSNYYTLHRSDLAARAAPLDPRLSRFTINLLIHYIWKHSPS